MHVERTVLLALFFVTLPLPNTWSACVGKNRGTDVCEGRCDVVTLDGSTNLLRARSAHEGDLGLQTSRFGLLGQVGHCSHVLVGAIRTGANEGGRDLVLPPLGLDEVAELGQGSGEIGSEWSVELRLNFG